MASGPNTRLAGTLFAILSLFVLPAVSQQGVLANGNSQLPSCAQQCTLLNQAAQACSGTTSASTQVWSCFCQSAYLTPLKAGGAGTGVCDQQCTNPTDNQQVATWYRSNCGNDFGASEHADAGTGTTNGNNNAGNNGGTNTQNPAATTSATTIATASPQASSGGGGSWWSNHYQWIIMVIVLFFGLIGLAVFLTWLRRRHERKQDQIRNGFNHGVTSQSAPTGINAANSRAVEPIPTHDSAQRTRESFMPYGYGYSRSDSRVGSRSSRIDDRRSPIPRGGTPVTDREKEVAVGGNTQASSDDEITKAPPRGILVRERSGPESTHGEKN